MEPFGLATSIAGLAPLFKVCLQLYDVIDTGRSHGGDFEVLSIRLGIERIRLQMWGERMGLDDATLTDEQLRAKLDERLVDRRVASAVSDVLACMKRVFEDSDGLQRTYGLAPLDSMAPLDGARPPGAFRTTFRRTLDRFNSASAARQQGATITQAGRWAVVDKRRFEVLLGDLRDFNDSLAALFPDVDDDTREGLAKDIKEAKDVESLRRIETAVAGEHDDLFDAASARLVEIGDGKKKEYKADTKEDTEDGTTTVMDDTSSILLRPVDVNQLSKDLERLEAQMTRRNRGRLRVSINHSFGARYYSYTGWDDIVGEEWLERDDKEVEFVKTPYQAWTLQHAEKKKDEFNDMDFSDFDPEAGWTFCGRIPGTTTVEGYCSEFCRWAEANTPSKPELVTIATHQPPALNIPQLVERYQTLQARGDLPWGWTNKQVWDETKEFIGKTSSTFAQPEYEYEMTMQLMSLTNMLNRNDIFENPISSSPGIAAHGHGTHGIPNYFLQIILAYETLIRFKRDRDGSIGGFSGATQRVIATMVVAERWMRGVKMVVTDPVNVYIEYHSLVHQRQVEGLVRFAEAIEWPALGEMREFTEDVYATIRGGGKVAMDLWDWTYGLTLPGTYFIYKIMSALVNATPNFKESIGGAQFHPSSVVLPDRSYWRSRHVVGRVLAGLPGAKCVAGWIGPCPLPEDGKPGWVRVRARTVEFKMARKVYDSTDIDAEDDDEASAIKPTPLQSKMNSAFIRTMGEARNWRVVEGLPKALDTVRFVALRLRKLPTSGKDPAHAPARKDGDDQIIGSTEEFEQRATVVVSINGAEVDFTLYNNPTFIAAHHCIDGPHAVHERDLPKLSNVVTVGQLKGRTRDDSGVLVINATCEAGELVARAWCAENGQHAVVRKGRGTCYSCAVQMASDEGLGVNCLIWA